MRVALEGVQIETAEYAENEEISFTCITMNDQEFADLSDALSSERATMELKRGGESIEVRLLEYEVNPPFSRRMGGSLHRHSIRLAQVAPAHLPLPGYQILTRRLLAVAR